ncbi:MAG TPA: GNAT family N-acetyltransferase [Bradyrhizobium sp.]|uniref:GNAT family N-acetyltransferase n=1 Tax=Bradyrhizobium sp. TaxID=376 RepID=UPI002D805A8F|nr:GNAT family N-acetyltransferase [Bradyrhizobium sp.]HET7885680.1 GNAT family N-acetyltransferase [Bradyrhizobium sp.]
MTMAAAMQGRKADTPAWSQSSRIAAIDIFNDIDEVEAIWRSLENQRHLSTPYQRLDFLRPWQKLVGTREGVQPLIVVAYDRDRMPLLLLPLVLKRGWGTRSAHFMGGKHATFNMALWNRDFATVASRADLNALFASIRDKAGVDVLAFEQQPLAWQGLPNPFALLPHQTSPNDCPTMTFAPGSTDTMRISNSVRRRLKGKERKLKALPGYRYQIATADADIKRLLDAFFRIKPQRMAEQGLPDVFAEPGVEDFIRTACTTLLPDGGRAIDIHALESDEDVIAVFAGVADGHRFSMMFNTYTLSASSRFSPGLILIRHIVDHYAERGYRALDLGIGSDDYKKLFCKTNEAIFDCFIPLSPRGSAVTAIMSSVSRAKRVIKRSPALSHLAQRLRYAFR